MRLVILGGFPRWTSIYDIFYALPREQPCEEVLLSTGLVVQRRHVTHAES